MGGCGGIFLILRLNTMTQVIWVSVFITGVNGLAAPSQNVPIFGAGTWYRTASQ